MASTAIYDDLKGFLQGALAPMPVLDFDQIETVLQQQNNQMLVLEEVYAGEDVIAFGSPREICMREEAEFIVHAFVPAPESAAVARALSDQVTQVLRFQRINDLRISRVGRGEPEDLNDGLWTAFSISTTVFRDHHVALP